MEIKLKRANSKEIKLDDKHSIVVDYPTFKQNQNLNYILAEIFAIESLLEKADTIEKSKLIAKKMNLMQEYMNNVVRYCLKGVKGYDFEIKLKDNELDEDTYEAICYDINQVRELFELITKEIEFNEVDKKK